MYANRLHEDDEEEEQTYNARLAFEKICSYEPPKGKLRTSPDVLGTACAGGRSYLIAEGYSTEVEIITQAEAWLLLGRAAHTTLPIP